MGITMVRRRMEDKKKKVVKEKEEKPSEKKGVDNGSNRKTKARSN